MQLVHWSAELKPLDTLALMVCRLSREIDNHSVAVLGSFTPLAYAAYMLAKLTHAPRSHLAAYNCVDIDSVELSMLSTEGAIYSQSAARRDFLPLVKMIHLAGRGSVECISSAQLDGRCSVNFSVIGDYASPRVRLPGGAGAPEVIQNYKKFVAYYTNHDRRTLVPKVDFVTGCRVPLAVEDRARAGLAAGPVLVVTSLAVLRYSDELSTFVVESLHPGVRATDVVENTGFDLVVPRVIPETALPTDEEMQALSAIDPFGTIRFDAMPGKSRRAYLETVIGQEWARAERIIATREKSS